MTDNLLTIPAAAKKLGMTTAGLRLLVDLNAVQCHNGRVTLRRVRSAMMTLANAAKVFGYRDGSNALYQRVANDKLTVVDPNGYPATVTVREMLRMLSAPRGTTRGKKIGNAS